MATEEQLKALPILRADARVQLVCVKWHRHLAGTQITVQTNEGEFRIPKALWPLAKKAVEALDTNGAYEGLDEGVLPKCSEMWRNPQRMSAMNIPAGFSSWLRGLQTSASTD